MKKVGLFKKTEEKRSTMAAVKNAIKNHPDNWKEIEGKLSQYGFYQDGISAPIVIVDVSGFCLKIYSLDAVYIYGIWDCMKIGWAMPMSEAKIMSELSYRRSLLSGCGFPGSENFNNAHGWMNY